MKTRSTETRRRILEAALRLFASHGYRGASVERIATLARVAKPAIYYHFKSKDGLYRALVETAQDERHHLMMEAARNGARVEDRLVAVLEALFRFARERRELTRLCFVTAFATPGEVPHQKLCIQKARRNFDFFHSLIRAGMKSGEVNPSYNSRTLATALYGQIFTYAFTQAISHPPTVTHATPREAVRLFLRGAGPPPR